MAAKKLELERENAKKKVDAAAHRLHPTLAPGPNLRRHQVDHGDSLLLQLLRQAEMEVGRIGQDGEVGTGFARGVYQFLEFAPDARYLVDNFEQANNCETRRVDNGFDASFAHFRPRTSEEPRIGPKLAQTTGESASVAVAGSFASGDQDGGGHRCSVYQPGGPKVRACGARHTCKWLMAQADTLAWAEFAAGGKT